MIQAAIWLIPKASKRRLLRKPDNSVKKKKVGVKEYI